MAGNLRIVNMAKYKPVDGELLVRCDRKSILGNPFFMEGKSPEQRLKVCKQYQAYFDLIIGVSDSSKLENTEHFAMFLLKISSDPGFIAKFKAELKRITELLNEHDVALGCWCHPLRCHVLTIYNYIIQANK